jgi:exosortase B
MSTATITLPRLDPIWKSSWPILLGLLVLYFPTYKALAGTLWLSEEYGHGPIILAIVLWITWQGRSKLVEVAEKKNPVIGSVFLIFGLLLYGVGRSQEIYIFEVGSQIPLLLGVVLMTHGAGVAKKFWFPLLFLVFLIPLPGFVVDTLTGPLKQQVSVLAEYILYHLGYPIARSGVMLSIGNYQLLVADACSGLNSMFSLSALGLFYAYLVKRSGWVHNTILLASILPIAFFANVTRVILLVLITYYFGDEVGQGFAHKMAGLVLFMSGLISFLVLDGVIQGIRTWRLEKSK